MERDEIDARLRAAARTVLGSRSEVALAYLYGSSARGQALPSSDVDLGVVLSETPEEGRKLELELRLENELIDASGLDRLDVRILNGAPLLIQGAAVTEGVAVYERNRAARVSYETWARSRYFDYLPAARAMAAAFGETLRARLAEREREAA